MWKSSQQFTGYTHFIDEQQCLILLRAVLKILPKRSPSGWQCMSESAYSWTMEFLQCKILSLGMSEVFCVGWQRCEVWEEIESYTRREAIYRLLLTLRSAC